MVSDNARSGMQQAPARSLFNALGFTAEEMKKPMIGIVSSYNEIVPGHMNIDKIVNAVKLGVAEAGGVPVVFPAIAVCDGIAMGHVGMKYSLVTRDLIADSTECMAIAHQFDGLVMVPNCDKNVPGLLMAAARLNLPTVFVSGGPMLAGHVKGKKRSLSSMFEAVGSYAAGTMTEEDVLEFEEVNENLEKEGKKPAEILAADENAEVTRFMSDEEKKKVVDYMEAGRRYLGQMDLNIKSPLVWEFYDNTLKTLAGYGAKIVRLDAFAYAPKEPGEKNFLNEPGTWDLLEKVRKLADKYNLTLLPEIHASYGEKNYEQIAGKGYMTYDFFLPGLIIDALESGDGKHLFDWAKELIEKDIHTVNMLGCHDGIPLLDLKGLLSEERIQNLIDTVVGRGGYVKDLHGQKNMYYQVNATYYSALGEDDAKMLLARALQLFMPGKPQIWYLDLFAGKNDHEAVKRAGAGGHKEINRTNLTTEQMEEALKKPVVARQLELLRFRSTCPAFEKESRIMVNSDGNKMEFTWENDGYQAKLKADLKTFEFVITETAPDGQTRTL